MIATQPYTTGGTKTFSFTGNMDGTGSIEIEAPNAGTCTNFTVDNVNITYSSQTVSTVCAGGNDSYMFGFNGKEKLNEQYGEGDAYDFGARLFDARLGRWLSIDPLMKKYPWETPYCYTGNSPIINKEFNGKDYGVYIDHSTKTIIIKAEYYVVSGDKDSYNAAMNAATFWNNESGKYQYKVGKGDNAVYYDIKFELNVYETEDPEKMVGFDGSATEPLYDENGNKIGNKVVDGVRQNPIANTFQLVDGSELTKLDTYEFDAKGSTSSGNKILVDKKAENLFRTSGHEFGHTLGIEHIIYTIMNAIGNTPEATDGTDKELVGVILGRAEIGNQIGSAHANYDAKAKKVETGDAPKNFKKGKVVNKKGS